MPIWLTVLRKVPWGDVIDNAPKVVEAAKRLWRSTKESRAAVHPPGPETRQAEAEHPVAALQERIDTLEAVVEELQGEMRQSAEVIKALADQNAQLVRKVESLTVRSTWLTVIAAAAAVAAVVALGLFASAHP